MSSADWQQFLLLVVINAFVGGMVGLERAVLPLLAEHDFGLTSRTAVLSFIVTFGVGINRGLCWSTTVIMKIDLVGPARRGLAMGLNEFAGYLAVSLAALASGYLAATYALLSAALVGRDRLGFPTQPALSG